MPKVSYMGNGSTTEFNFVFPFYETTDIVVTKNTTTLTSGYTVVGTPAGTDANIPYTGGKVVFDVAPIATDSIVIARHLPLTRVVDYQPTAKIDPTTLNQDMNYTIEVLKDFNDELGEFNIKYAELTDIELIQTVSTKIDTVTAQIIALGDISTLRQYVTANTENISTLDTRTTGMTDYVIESQNPTASNNYTWYRKYKSGWVEMGGQIKGGFTKASTWNTRTITLPLTMANTDYIGTVMTTWNYSAGNAYYQDEIYCSTGTTTEMTLSYINISDLTNTICNWVARGKYAQ